MYEQNCFEPPGRPEPYWRPFCRDLPRCAGCPYCGHGFVCRGADGKCMRSEAARINHYEIKGETEYANGMS